MDREKIIIVLTVTLGAIVLGFLLFFTPLGIQIFSLFFGHNTIEAYFKFIFGAVLFSPVWIMLILTGFFVFFIIKKTKQYKKQNVGEKIYKSELIVWWSVLGILLGGLFYLWQAW